MRSLEQLSWEDVFVRTFPGDTSASRTSRQLPGACYALVEPTKVAAPRLLCWSREAGEQLGLAEAIDRHARELAGAVLGGNQLLPGMRPYAAGYAGHQFGSFAGQLGDGRAITLGEHVAPDGARWELQLKGAGPTPYSRRSDGRAVLRSSVREFLCSEAMHHLGVPTTRALALVATGEQVLRDMFYDGRPKLEPGAVVTRLAPTFLRFGSFELLSWRQEHAQLARLVYYAIAGFFPELAAELPAGGAGPVPDTVTLPGALVARWFSEIARRTAVMIAHWMRVGFVHGVMNTDNMSILGLTIDYGPYGWIEPFDPDFTPNTTDATSGRYRFGMQPGVAQWNLAQLARALLPLCPEPGEREALAAGLEEYRETFQRVYGEMMLGKLGLVGGDAPADDEALVNSLLELLATEETDYTLWFSRLSQLPLDGDDSALLAAMAPAAYAAPSPSHAAASLAWLRRYAARAARVAPAQRAAAMATANPVFVPRNYLVQEAIERAEASTGASANEPDVSGVLALLAAARSPYRAGPEHAGLLDKRPEWARHRAGCSALSCSS